VTAAVRRTVLALLLVLLAGSALAIDTETPLPDPAQQARYTALIHELRCLQCQNQTIADSAAGLAADLRHEVRGMVASGKSDDEIRRFLTDRYGDFVLYQPPVRGRTVLLWAAPVLLLLAGLATVGVVIVRRSRRPIDLESEPEGGGTAQ
jgi:cytochrome c-type biogenesis protein CcmH